MSDFEFGLRQITSAANFMATSMEADGYIARPMKVRPATHDDLPGILEIYNEAVANTTASYDYEPRTLEHRIAWFENHVQNNLPVFVAVTETGRTLPGLEYALGGCGVTVLGRATAAGIAGVVRTAFDPAVRGEVNRRQLPALLYIRTIYVMYALDRIFGGP